MTYPAQADALEIRAVDETVLVYDSTHEKIYVLNKSAAFVLQSCDGTNAPPDLARLLSESSGADYATVSRDVAFILKEFANLKLLAQ